MCSGVYVSGGFQYLNTSCSQIRELCILYVLIQVFPADGLLADVDRRLRWGRGGSLLIGSLRRARGLVVLLALFLDASGIRVRHDRAGEVTDGDEQEVQKDYYKEKL